MASSLSQLTPESALSSLLHSSKVQNHGHHASQHLTLAYQVLHDLQYQHLWTGLHVHTHSPLAPHGLLPRPLISGLPPTRLYVHPDEQIELLKHQAKQRRKKEGSQTQKPAQVEKGDQSGLIGTKEQNNNTGQHESSKHIAPPSSDPNGDGTIAGPGDPSPQETPIEFTAPELMPEREWVLPTRLCESWTLHRLADVFDAITNEPPSTPVSSQSSFDGQSREPPPVQHSKWRNTKRVVLAAVDDDSSVVYYIIHDGTVKPRQN